MMGIRKAIQLLILAFASSQVAGQGFNPELLKIQSLYAQGQYSEVISDEFFPSGQEEQQLYYFVKGNCAYQLGDLETAIQLFNQVERLNRGAAALELARCYKLKDDYTQMFKYLAEHLNSSKKMPRKEIMLDPVFSDLDRDREWIRFWSDSWYDENEDIIAEAQYQIKQNDLDETFWNDLIKKYDDNAAVLALIVQYYQLTGESSKADQTIEKAINIDPDNLDINIQYGDYLMENKAYDNSVQVFNRMISQHPYEIRLYLHRVLAIFKSGQSNRGVEEISRLGKLGIDASGMYFLLARELISDNPVTAIEYLDQVLSNKPTAPAFNLRAKAQHALGDDQEAISDLAMSLDIDPKQPNVYFFRAELRLKTGDNDGACYDWQHALQLGHRKAADMLYKYCK